jgi:hypothetical protein
MSEKELGDLLRDQLAAVEPPPMSPTSTLHRGRRARRLRRGLFAGVVVAVTGSAVTYVANLDDAPAQTVTVAQDPDPARLDAVVEELATRVFSPHYPALPAPRVEVRDREGNPVGPEDSALSSVQAIFDLPGEAELGFGANAGSADDRTGCADWAGQSGAAAACSVRDLPDGTQVRVVVLSFAPPAPGQDLRTLLTEEERSTADPDTMTWSRSVTAFAPDGDISGGFELVQAPSYEAAQATWKVPVGELTAAVTDPAMTAYDFD